MTSNERRDLDVLEVIRKVGRASGAMIANRTGTQPRYIQALNASLRRLRDAGKIRHHRGLWEIAG